MSILRIKKGAEINLFLERSRKRVREKSGKKISLASRRRDREYRKRFFLAIQQGKKSERKCRKGFSLLKSGEKESAEKDFSTLSIQKKRVRESAEKDSLC